MQVTTTLSSDRKERNSDELIKQLRTQLEARELIKIRVLENCGYSAKELAGEIGERTNSIVVQVIGTKIVLYRQNKDAKKRKIELDD